MFTAHCLSLDLHCSSFFKILMRDTVFVRFLLAACTEITFTAPMKIQSSFIIVTLAALGRIAAKGKKKQCNAMQCHGGRADYTCLYVPVKQPMMSLFSLALV
jgi:hypothetical protein